MVRRKRGVAFIVLKCVIIGCCASAQQAAFGTEMVTPSKPAVGGYILVAQADTPAESQAIVQETQNADAPAEPQAVMQEIKSATRLPSRTQLRRKPKIAGVPAGSQVVVKETKEPELQAVVNETKEPEAQTVSGEVEETDVLDKPLAVAQETNNDGASAKLQAEAKGLKVANAGRKKYGMAPIRWGVVVSETLGWERSLQTYHPTSSRYGSNISTRRGGFVNTQTAEIQAKTYILQPYIAQVGGRFGVVSSRNNSTTSTGSAGTVSVVSDNRNNKLFGDGSLSLFPQSRFPFNMTLGVSDDSNDASLQTQDTVTKHLKLNQTYRPMGSRSMYTLSYIRNKRITTYNYWSTLSGPNPNDTAINSLWQGGYSTITPEHRIEVATILNEINTRSTQMVSNRANSVMVSDSYLPTDSLLSIYSVANLNLSTDTNLSADTKSRARYLQANTNARWQPENEDIPLFVDGNARFFRMLSTIQHGVVTSTQSVGGNVGARYLFSNNLIGNATLGVTSTNSNGKRNLITIQRVSTTYSANAIKLWGDSTYSWNANGGAYNQTGGASVNPDRRTLGQLSGARNQIGGGPDSNVFGGVGHRLGVPYRFKMLDKEFLMNSRINQSLDTTISRVNGRSYTIINDGSVSLGGILASARPNKELLGGYGTAEGVINTTATLSVIDRHTIGGNNPSRSRTYSLILNLLETSKSVYSRYGIEFEATLGAFQGTEGTELIATGTAKYKKAGVFNVRGLDYLGSLEIGTRSQSRSVDVNAQNPRFPWELDQRLRYKIGQNEALLRGLVTDQHGVKNASLWLLFRAWRTIGN